MTKHHLKIFLVGSLSFISLSTNVFSMYDDERNEHIKTLIKLAEEGDSTGQFSLGLMYAKKEETPENLSQASNWLAKAAQNGHPLAREELASVMQKMDLKIAELMKKQSELEVKEINLQEDKKNLEKKGEEIAHKYKVYEKALDESEEFISEIEMKSKQQERNKSSQNKKNADSCNLF
jgi:TPR repeat protein